ncbi:MAG: Glycosyl transferase family 39 [Parcubacteria group bacterium GW2011_GWA1_47_9]|nr:MAG: Glycosyl transferase family 39 [Parcubacteria group bacterium GW2011_GWA1_47_9]
MVLTRKDYYGAFLVFLIALALRLPFISYPPAVVFDEGVYATFASKIIFGIPFFDVHPPLASLINAGVARTSDFSYKELRDIGKDFGEFPFVRVRALHALAGSFLAVVIYFCAKYLWEQSSYAFLASLFVALDNAFISYSRLILPDIWLLLFGFLGVLFVLVAEKKQSVAFLLLAGMVAGLAFSVKWSGLGFVAFGSLLLWRQKRLRFLAVFVSFAVLVYFFVFSLFFSFFAPSSVAPVSYPAPLDVVGIFRYNQAMFWEHGKVPYHFHSSFPYEWVLGARPIAMWGSGGQRIDLAPNIILWGGVFLALITVIIVTFMRPRGSVSLASDTYKLLVVGYLMNYVPFFFVARPLFLYHYFAPVLFGYLLLPAVLKQGAGIIAPNSSFQKTLFSFFALVFLEGVMLASRTYGF